MEQTVVMNCTHSVSPVLNKVCSMVAENSQALCSKLDVNVQVCMLNGVVKETFKHEVAIRFSSISEIIAKARAKAEKDKDTGTVMHRDYQYAKVLPQDDTTLSQHLTTLSEHGQLLYLRNNQDINDSWVVINKEVLLSQINGTVFAPEYFKQHHDISNSTGVVPFTKIKEIFPEYDPYMIIGFLTHLEFCYQIGESEALLIGTKQQNPHTSQSASYYFFPALVSEERPEESCKSIQHTHYKSGWCLKCSREDQFLTSRFLHVLLLRLAFSFALAPDHTTKGDITIPVVQRRCNVWKSGIHWQNMDGVEAIVEVGEQSTAVTVMIGCQKGGEMACVALRSDLIQTILEVKDKFSGVVEMTESFIHPSELVTYPVKSPKYLSTFSVNTIAAAIVEGKKFVLRKQGFEQQTLPVHQVVKFEPYTCFSSELINELFVESNSKEKLVARFLKELSENAQAITCELQQILGVKQAALKEAIRKSPSLLCDDPAHHCLLLFQVWKSQGHHTYGDLRAALDKYSVFCGRNPLVLAEVSTQIKKGDLSPLYSTLPLNPTERITEPAHTTPAGITQLQNESQSNPSSADQASMLSSDLLISDFQPASDKVKTISATKLWKLPHGIHHTLNGGGTIIAILDTPINAHIYNKQVKPHKAFEAAKLDGRLEELDFISSGTEKARPGKHGSMAAFVAAGGMFGNVPCGVAPNASLVVCSVADNVSRSYSYSAVIKAFEELTERKINGKGLDIMSMSFGCKRNYDSENQETIAKHIRTLTDLGVVCVASVGNHGGYEDVTFPACLDEVIAVGALNKYGKKRDSNPTQGRIDVYAPGEGIAAPFVAVSDEEVRYDSRAATDLGVEYHDGSSCAAPAIAGLVSLILQYSEEYVEDEKRGIYRKPEFLKELFRKQMVQPGDPIMLDPCKYFQDKLNEREIEELQEKIKVLEQR